MKRALPLALLIFTAALCPHYARAQANVDEGLEHYTFYVNGTTGSNSNPGTEQLPFKTIGWAATQAVINNQNNKGTHVWISNGTYRESISLTASSADTTWPITFEAINHGGVIISGGVLYTGWSTYSGNSSIYTNTWNNTWGVCATLSGCPVATYPQPDIMLRQEMVAVNSTVMTEVLSLTQMVQGTFYVDTTNKLIYLWPPAGTDMSTATVDVATEPTLFSIFGETNMVFRGLVFQYANSCRGVPAFSVTGNATFPSTNILFDDDTFQWNNGQALGINNPITYFTVEDSTLVHNGDSGIAGFQTQYGWYQSDVVGYNNWRGAQGAFYACWVSGFHSWQAQTDTLEDFTAEFNEAYGVHWDTDNVNITGESVVASQNLLSGLFVELNPGPFNFTDTSVCNQTSALSGGGFVSRNSEGISFTNGVLYNNANAQLAVIGVAGGVWMTDWLTGNQYDLFTENMTNTNNVIEGIGNSQYLFSDQYLNGSDWTTFLTDFVSNNNTWWNATNSTTEFQVPVPVTYTGENFASWQATTLQDSASTFAAPSGSPQNGCTVTAGANDYWVTANNATLTMNDAGQATFDLTVTPLLNFDGTVNFTLDGISEVPGLSAPNPASVNTSGTTTLIVSSTASTALGTYPITIIGNSGSQTRTVTVSVTVPVITLRLSTGSLTFASQQQGTTSPGQSFTIQNVGKTSITFTSITTSGAFAISDNTCGTTLLKNKTCTVTVTFTPNAVGTITGAVTIVDSDPSSPQTVSLTGTGTGAPVISLSPSMLSFGSQLVKSPSVPQTVTLTNTGESVLTFSGSNGIAVTGTDSGDYTQTNTCGTSVAVGASCIITVTFTPQTTGVRTASVTFTDNATDSPQNLNLTGIGAYPLATLDPPALEFGGVEQGYSSGALTSIVTNDGAVTLKITKVAVTGTDPKEYTETNNCVGSFAPGATCTISVIFSPTATGSQSATVTITDDTSTGSNTLTLTGSGALPTATLTPKTDSFGSVTVGTTSAAKINTLTNTSSYLLSVKSIAISGPDATNFAQTNNCPVGGTLAGEASCTISVTFTPSASGTRTATLTETDNSSDETHTVSLTGSGK
jgi:hypothetical protein